MRIRRSACSLLCRRYLYMDERSVSEIDWVNVGGEVLGRRTLIGRAGAIVRDRSGGRTRRYGEYSCEGGEGDGSEIHHIFSVEKEL